MIADPKRSNRGEIYFLNQVVIKSLTVSGSNRLTCTNLYEGGLGSTTNKTNSKNMTKSKTGSLMAAAALTGLIAGAMFSVTGCSTGKAGTESASSMHKHDCAGKNACKGQGGCKTATHACKGQNECKGQGGCKVA